MLRKSFLILLAYSLLSLFCTSSLDAQPVTTEELLNELMTILTLLETAQSEYQIVSSELQSIQSELLSLQTEEIPLLTMQLYGLKDLFSDYKQTVSQEITGLKIKIIILGGVSVGLLGLTVWVLLR